MRRVVITGMGTINPLGKNVKEFSESLKNNVIGIDRITNFDPSDLPVQIAGEIKGFKPEEFIDRKLSKRIDRYSQFALVAAKEAIENAKIDFRGIEDRVSVIIASGMGGFLTLDAQNEVFKEKGASRVSPFMIPMLLSNMASGVVSMFFGLRGPNFSVVSACASSVHAIALGALLIRHRYTDVAIIGGAEATIAPLPIAGFAAMKALSTRNEEPKRASRPFDRDRDGFVMAEGAGVLVLEAEEFAKDRKADIIAEVKGFGMNDDAYHFSAPHPEAEGSKSVMRIALKDAGLLPEDIDLVSCHATSTPVGDELEAKAILEVFGERDVLVNSTKALTGHLLGAAGVVETIAALIEMQEGFVHGMPNLDNPDEIPSKLNLVEESRNIEVNNFIKNSFGFGGHNACVVVGRY
ncbi:3-oxoacyl-ACP synthase [Thermosipho melanesiensis]|uniref:3-oxoacyl-[acyl-carrier-protein] synthase 2 n=2 Tax=Thermosipho melanesiensis TaxID=46541 RepID=A6LNC8_THEM4|nr:beta-ketoacyl-ACP synthase II [Thermosipho melanesiensis]ABR31429.1 Beta-ketoacyl synthase-like protein [Thermosipho melanesiensis BI429]APT74488.1 3-oxoacyl-ACP synthase [Thermosipho melanesiensis]OOC36447.1 3-oxoacyl-ACP synthase [Thermosipho melanesiensis]OOC37265.1 3-oxoacyl-ACP synthase [Thermosipho melanesiensis]OOC38017.1 3-oxoacyl-ACP synthase [Thermosipho melanesiensis]